MKKLTLIICEIAILLLTAIILAPTIVTAAENESRIIVDDTHIGTSTGNLLPLCEIITHIGGTVAWSGTAQEITIRRGSLTAILTIDEPKVTINNRNIVLATPPALIEGQVMVSLCFLANHLGLGAGHKNNSFILSTNPARQIPILIYHHILPDEVNTHFRDNPWTVSAENFAAQMRYLSDNGFYTPTLDELEAFLYNGRPLPANSVMIHFDDGYYSNYVYAYPILLKYGLRAVLFPITAYAKALGDYQPPICHNSLTKTAAVTLRTSSDVFETASHTHNLHSFQPDTLDSVLLAASREDIIEDMLQSFEFVSNHRAFAFPFGQLNTTITDAIAAAGITMAFTTRAGYVTNTSDPLRLNRFTVYQGTTIERFRAIVNRRV